MSSAVPKRYHCFHCGEDLHYRVFCRHKEEFYDPLTNQWKLKRNDDEDSNESIFTREIDDSQNDVTSSNDYSEFNAVIQSVIGAPHQMTQMRTNHLVTNSYQLLHKKVLYSLDHASFSLPS